MSRPESRPARIRPTRVAAAACVMVGALALAGCGAGQIAQTSEQVAAVGGANASAGQIAIRNAEVEFDTAAEGAAIYLAGTDAPLVMHIVNTGGQPDRLVAASSPVATSVQISGGTLEVPAGQSIDVSGVPAEPVATAAPTAPPAAPGATPAPTTTPAPTAAAAEPGTASIVLTGLRQDLQAGPTYPVVLTFERAGDVQVAVPMGNPDVPRQDAH